MNVLVAIATLTAALGSPAPAPTAWIPALQLGQALPIDPAFVSQDGRVFRWHQLAGSSVILAFVYTRCRESNECPAISAKFAEMQHQLPRGVRLLTVTLDPAYDTPAVLRRYGETFGQDTRYWTLATGNPLAVLAFAQRFNVVVSPGRQAGQLEHGEALAIFDPQQRLVSLTAGNDWQPREALAVARQTLGMPSSAFDRIALWFRNFGTTCGALLTSEDGWLRSARIAFAGAATLFIVGLCIFLGRQLL